MLTLSLVAAQLRSYTRSSAVLLESDAGVLARDLVVE